MKNDFDVRHLNVAAFARAGGQMVGEERLPQLGRLLEESQGVGSGCVVRYAAHGELRSTGAAQESVWLRLSAEVALPMTCQRCLGSVDVPVGFEREYRFVATEEQAELEDESSEEDVLAISRDFNVLELIEDELLMELPPVPKHDTCPEPVQLQAVDPDFDDVPDEKPNPFAVLGQLKKRNLS